MMEAAVLIENVVRPKLYELSNIAMDTGTKQAIKVMFTYKKNSDLVRVRTFAAMLDSFPSKGMDIPSGMVTGILVPKLTELVGNLSNVHQIADLIRIKSSVDRGEYEPEGVLFETRQWEYGFVPDEFMIFVGPKSDVHQNDTGEIATLL